MKKSKEAKDAKGLKISFDEILLDETKTRKVTDGTYTQRDVYGIIGKNLLNLTYDEKERLIRESRLRLTKEDREVLAGHKEKNGKYGSTFLIEFMFSTHCTTKEEFYKAALGERHVPKLRTIRHNYPD